MDMTSASFLPLQSMKGTLRTGLWSELRPLAPCQSVIGLLWTQAQLPSTSSTEILAEPRSCPAGLVQTVCHITNAWGRLSPACSVARS